MSGPYTHGIWKVKPGRADEFVEAWSSFARWSADNAPGAMWVKLLRDTADPDRFFTFGPWESAEAVEAWRAMPEWQASVGKIRELLESFQPDTLELLLEIGTGE